MSSLSDKFQIIGILDFCTSPYFTACAYAFVYFQFMVLLVLRHTLPFLISGAGEYSLTLFTVSLASAVFLLFKDEMLFRKM